MDQIIHCILLLLNLSGTFSKYVYIDMKTDWSGAQEYCQLNHIDLAPVSGELDMQKLQELSDSENDYIWIGLERNSSEKKQWLWSGGGEPSRFFWGDGQPSNNEKESKIFMSNAWHDAEPRYQKNFFCYDAKVVKEKNTWEKALDYCREIGSDLASVASETEMLLIQRELNKHNTTEHVWIALHFFSGDWLWVDGQEMNYEAWDEEENPACPHPKMECAALQLTGGTKGVWEARDCEERLNFICY